MAPKKELESRSSSAAATLGVAAATGNADDNFFLPSRISRANDLSRRKFRAKEFWRESGAAYEVCRVVERAFP